MTKRDFIELSEKTFNDIEQLVDDQYPDVDFDREGNVLTLTLEDGKVVVINRQEAMEEMWLASPLGGMHFYYDDTHNFWGGQIDAPIAALPKLLTHLSTPMLLLSTLQRAFLLCGD